MKRKIIPTMIIIADAALTTPVLVPSGDGMEDLPAVCLGRGSMGRVYNEADDRVIDCLVNGV